ARQLVTSAGCRGLRWSVWPASWSLAGCSGAFPTPRRSSTSSSERSQLALRVDSSGESAMRLSQVARYLYRMKWYVLCVLAVVTLAGEVYLRLPCGRQLEYQSDPELGGVFRPGQSSS